MFEQLAASLPQAICQEFRLALVNGYWRCGLPLTKQQKRTCQEALFFHQNNSDNVHEKNTSTLTH